MLRSPAAGSSAFVGPFGVPMPRWHGTVRRRNSRPTHEIASRRRASSDARRTARNHDAQARRRRTGRGSTPWMRPAGWPSSRSTFAYEDCPPEVIRQAKRCTVETIGCALGARSRTPLVEAALRALRQIRRRRRRRDARIVGATGRRAAPDRAAFVNGVAANALDYDTAASCCEPLRRHRDLLHAGDGGAHGSGVGPRFPRRSGGRGLRDATRIGEGDASHAGISPPARLPVMGHIGALPRPSLRAAC